MPPLRTQSQRLISVIQLIYLVVMLNNENVVKIALQSQKIKPITEMYLHDAHNGPTIIRKVLNTRNYIGCVKERRRMTCQDHVEIHQRHRRPLDQSNNRSPR